MENHLSRRKWLQLCSLLGLGAAANNTAVALANEAGVVSVKVERTGKDIYRFDVTVRHDDEGWSHYADMWKVVLPDGRVAATRVLQHPHVDEQPFTRGMADIEIPAGTDSVFIRVHDSVHHYGGKEAVVKLPR